MTATAEQSAAEREARSRLRPILMTTLAIVAGLVPTALGLGAGSAQRSAIALGLVLPVTLAAGWEIAVGLGLSTGRLLPPPSVIFDTFLDLASTGELQAHTLATVMRVAAGFFSGATRAQRATSLTMARGSIASRGTSSPATSCHNCRRT